jgi:hypothetical protein
MQHFFKRASVAAALSCRVVEFATKEEMETALAKFNDYELFNRKIRVYADRSHASSRDRFYKAPFRPKKFLLLILILHSITEKVSNGKKII